jgi:hypothetical protein
MPRRVVTQDIEVKNKELQEELAKLDAKYRNDEDIKTDDKDKERRKGQRQKKEKEKAKLHEKIEKITEGDLLKVLEFLEVVPRPKINDVRDMIWVGPRPWHRKSMRTWTAA